MSFIRFLAPFIVSSTVLMAGGGKPVVGGGGGTPGVLSLRLSSETAPAGGVVQVKLLLTEPSPISTGKVNFEYDTAMFSDVLGINLIAPGGDVSGTAIVSNGRLSLHFTSPKGTFGTVLGYPILTIAMKIRADKFPGSASFVSLNTSTSAFSGLLGATLASTIKPGLITVGTNPAVYNVLPGGGKIKAGDPITIIGSGFDKGSKVSLDPAGAILTQFVNSNTLILTTKADFQLDGARVRINNPDKTTVEYYSYLRGQSSGISTDAVLAQAVPLFSGNEYNLVEVPTANPAFGQNQDTGIALENATATAADVRMQMTDAFGVKLGETLVQVPAYMKMTRTVQELFGVKPTVVSVVKVRSLIPVRVLGILIDQTALDVYPINVYGVPVP